MNGSNGSRLAANRVLRLLPYTSLLGLVGLLATSVLGFEEPHSGMLLACGILLSSAPVGMLLHFAFTTELAAFEKGLWLKALVRRGGVRIATAYFRESRRHSVTQGLLKAAGRRS